MDHKGNKPLRQYIGIKRQTTQLKYENFEVQKSPDNKENGIIRMTYKLNKNIFKINEYIILFEEKFVEHNKNKSNIIITGKELETKYKINFEEFEKYGINKNDEILEVILKGKTIEDMSWMFFNCENLIKVDLSLFNPLNVKDMSCMFYGCTNLIKVDFSAFNNQNVTNMSWIFYGCKNLAKVDLSSFNTQNVINMTSMFYDCKNLAKVDLSSFNTQNVTSMDSMFYDCKNLMKIDLSSFNIRNVINVSKMLDGYIGLIKIGRKRYNKIKNHLRSAKYNLSIIEV